MSTVLHGYCSYSAHFQIMEYHSSPVRLAVIRVPNQAMPETRRLQKCRVNASFALLSQDSLEVKGSLLSLRLPILVDCMWRSFARLDVFCRQMENG
jgi:hypothetical protein